MPKAHERRNVLIDMTKQNHSGFTIWFTGLSGAGKTTLSRSVHEALREKVMGKLEERGGDMPGWA